MPGLLEARKWDSVRAILITPPLSDCWGKNARPLLREEYDAVLAAKHASVDPEWVLGLHSQLPAGNWMLRLATAPGLVAEVSRVLGRLHDGQNGHKDERAHDARKHDGAQRRRLHDHRRSAARARAQ